MVLSRPFYCPTRVVETADFAAELRAALAGRSYALITSRGWTRRGAIEKMADTAGAPRAVISSVEPNPRESILAALAGALPDADVVVALGGGSVLDAAKGAVAHRALGSQASVLSAHFREGAALPASMAPKPLIAIPTTSGTGSEVTRWATIWGDDGIKFSLTDERLYPAVAILDAALCLSMPREATLASGLDALSHSMEAVWNRNHSPLTDAFATAAIGALRAALAAVLRHPGDRERRREVQNASLLAGLAMSRTQTALAHSISYPFTAHHGVPHGLACSFTLGQVARFNMEADAERLRPIAQGLGCALPEVPQVIEAWFDELEVGDAILRYISPATVDGLGDGIITRARAANNLRGASAAEARGLARAALERLAKQPSREGQRRAASKP
jgi:alcohol dehydrogenase